MCFGFCRGICQVFWRQGLQHLLSFGPVGTPRLDVGFPRVMSSPEYIKAGYDKCVVGLKAAVEISFVLLGVLL